MGEEHECACADIHDDEITVRFGKGQSGGQRARHLIRQVVAAGDDRSIGRRENILAIDAVAVGLLDIADDEPAIGAGLLPVDGEALSQGMAAVERQESPDMADRVASTVPDQIAFAAKRPPSTTGGLLEISAGPMVIVTVISGLSKRAWIRCTIRLGTPLPSLTATCRKTTPNCDTPSTPAS